MDNKQYKKIQIKNVINNMLKLIKYPNPLLKKRLSLVENFNSEVKHIVREMFEYMYKFKGIGLAANQVGIDMQIIVVDLADKRNKNESYYPLALINPVILKYSNKKISMEEGCLSFPGFYEKIKRSQYIEIEYYDINGKKNRILANNLLARVVQHEVDHINGITFVQRLSAVKQIKFYANYFIGKYKF
ncbi:MAG: peptide deformylase [Endomicrobia bacterium]|nr:peptide deformylase [Endomicrobiia bacterium]